MAAPHDGKYECERGDDRREESHDATGGCYSVFRNVTTRTTSA
jgi:hypothetical protein